MSAQAIKILIAAALSLHGLGHGGALGALIWIGRGGKYARVMNAVSARPTRLRLLHQIAASRRFAAARTGCG